MKKFTFSGSIIVLALCICGTIKAQIISTVAGNGIASYSGDGGQATAAEINQPYGVVVDDSGNVFVGEWTGSRVRKVEHGTGIITTYAGNGIGGYTGDGGQATAAEMTSPVGLALDDSDNLYIGDFMDNAVRKVYARTGIVVTIAGNGTGGFSGDGGQATAAQIYHPYGVSLDAAGNIYFADEYNMRVRKVTKATGIISTIAGTGTGGYNGDNMLGTSAQLYYPLGVWADKLSGNVYIADQFNERIRKVNTNDSISTVVGNGTSGYTGDGGQATAAELHYPYEIVFDSLDNMYVADTYNNVVRKVDMGSGIISTIAGNGTQGYSGDGGPATAAELYYPSALSFDKMDNLFIADYGNNRTREVTSLIITGAAEHSTIPAFVDVYPNPATGNFYLNMLGLPGNVSIELYDELGNRVMNKIAIGGQVLNLPVTNFASGIYILKVTPENGVPTVKKVNILN